MLPDAPYHAPYPIQDEESPAVCIRTLEFTSGGVEEQNDW